MLTHLQNILHKLRASLWLIPSLMCLSALGLALTADWLDAFYHESANVYWPSWLIYQGDLDGARALLSTVAGSMITVAGVTFSITMVALSLASSQFGPRLLMNFMRDTANQFVLGTFVSTFLYCLLALGNDAGPAGRPPAASASIGLVLAVISVFVLIYFIHHVSSTIRAEHVVQSVAKDAIAAIARLTAPEKNDEKTKPSCFEPWPNVDSKKLVSRNSGYIQAIDEQGLVASLAKLDAVMILKLRPGKFIAAGECLAEVYFQNDHECDIERFQRYFIVGHCRTDEQDPEYGISQLVEVAVRALSPGINDPHTAIACIDWLGSGIRQVANKALKGAYAFDGQAELRLVRDITDFSGLLDTAFDQIRQNSVGVPSVAIHLLDTLAKVFEAINNEERKEAILRQARLILQGAKNEQWLENDMEDLRQRYKHFDTIFSYACQRL